MRNGQVLSEISELLPIQKKACEKGKRGLIVKSQQDKLIRPGTELMVKLLEGPGEN